MGNEQIAKLLIQLSVFGIVVALWMAAVVVWMLRRSRQRQRLERRLQFAQQGAVEDERVIRLWHDGQAVDTFVPDTESMGPFERLERLRQDAGWSTPMPKLL